MPLEPGRVQAVFLAALEQENPDDREAFLDRECAADAELRERVESLLIAHDQPGSFLDRPFIGSDEPDAAIDAHSNGKAGGLHDEHPFHFLTVDHTPTPVPAEAAGRHFAEGPGSRIGPYKLLQLIGEGGMGAVYMAEQEHPVRRRVALKIIKPGMDSEQVIGRFEAERQALAMMDHQSIARVLDAGATDAGRPYFVMELVHGASITQYCDEAQLTPRRRLELFVPVCQAIQHAHQKGIIHRDIKPSNVLVTMYDGKPVPKVIDFGIAKAIDQRLTERTMFTQYGSIIGTLEYMSPEQAEMSAMGADTRSDIYSLGVMLYELMTGSTPLDRMRLNEAGYVEILRRIKEEDPRKPSTRLSGSGDALPIISSRRKTDPTRLTRLMRGELDWIIMKSLEKDRGRRYETAVGFARDIQNFLGGRPVEACPPSTSYRLRKFIHRNQGLVVAASIVLFALVAGVIGTTWGLVRAERALKAEALRAEGERRAREREAAERIRAEGAEKQARESEADTHAFSHFLVKDVLSVARPKGERGGLGIDVTVKRALTEATGKIGERFQGRPRAEAVARFDLGETFQLVGEPVRAVEQLEKALALRKSVLGPADRDTLEAMIALSGAYSRAGMFDRAIPLAEEAVKLTEAKRGPNHADTLSGESNLATIYAQAGEPNKALPLMEKVLKLERANLGPDHDVTINTVSNLAAMYPMVRKPELAMPLVQEALAVRKAKLGPDHPETIAAMCNLAALDWSLGKLDQSVPLFEEALALRKTSQGIDHPDTILVGFNLAMNYADAGRLPDAVMTCDERMARARATLNPGQPPRDTGVPIGLEVYRRGNLWDKRESLLREQCELVKEASGAESIEYAERLGMLGLNLLRQQQLAESEETLAASLAIREKLQPDSWATFHAKSRLGSAILYHRRAFAEAEALLQQGYEGMKAREVQIPNKEKDCVDDAGQELLILYMMWEKPEKADQWRARMMPSANDAGRKP